jgi:large subunit ribosomal protein L25
MSQQVQLQVDSRSDRGGSGASRRLRRAGKVPAVVYGGGVAPEAVELDPRPILALLGSESGRNTLIQLRIGERELKRMVMLREVQWHPVTGRLLHADFVRVEMDKKIAVDVAIHALGVPLGVKNEGGTLDLVHRTIRIKVLPNAIPDFIEVDVSELHAGQHIEASEVKLPAGAELAMPPHETIVTVLGKTAEPEPEAAPADAAAPAETPAPETKG